MGKIILCTGKQSQIPYIFTESNVGVYSIEEMACYLYTHVYEVYEGFVTEELIVWIQEELEMRELGEKLATIKETGNSLKEGIGAILRSNDYYTEKEVKALMSVIESIMGLSRLRRNKLRGDNYLKYGMYYQALKEYQNILLDGEMKTLKEVERGNVLHNMGIVFVHTIGYVEAQKYFQDAYHLNHNKDSLQQYMVAILLAGEEEKFNQECDKYHLPKDYKRRLYDELYQKEEEVKQFAPYRYYRNLLQMREKGRFVEYQKEVKSLLGSWKKKYRKQVDGI